MSTNAGGLQGGLYLIVLDDLHTDLARTALVKASARRFIERDLADTDLAAVVTTSGRFEAVQDFTSNRRLLLAAVDTFVGQKLRSAVLEKLDSYRREMDLTGQDLGQLGKPVNDAYDVQRGQRARNTLLTLKNLAESLSGVHGRRKALVYISEGIDYTTTNFEKWRELSGNARRGVSIEGDLRDAITAASRANVSIYSIDPRGLTNMGDTGIEINYIPEDPNLRLDSAGLLEELRLSQESLRVLAERDRGPRGSELERPGGGTRSCCSGQQLLLHAGVLPRQPETRRRVPADRSAGEQTRLAGSRAQGLRLTSEWRDAGRAPSREGGGIGGAGRRAESPDPDKRPHIARQRRCIQRRRAEHIGGGRHHDRRSGIHVRGEGRLDRGQAGSVGQGHRPEGTIRGSEHFDLNIRIRPESRRILIGTGFRVISKIDVPPGKYSLHIGARESGGGSRWARFSRTSRCRISRRRRSR